MIIDYLPDGSDDCPLIRLRNGSNHDYQILIEAIRNLIDHNREIKLFSFNGFSKGGSIEQLIFKKEKEDTGILEVTPGNFVCAFSEEHLLEIEEKLSNYKEDSSGYHWLNDDLGISLLLSNSGKW